MLYVFRNFESMFQMQVYIGNSNHPLFFVANRGHHADIGGMVPGSMPPNSTSLNQEGVIVTSFKIVENGVFNEQGFLKVA